jgi:hypothetical protein
VFLLKDFAVIQAGITPEETPQQIIGGRLNNQLWLILGSFLRKWLSF